MLYFLVIIFIILLFSKWCSKFDNKKEKFDDNNTLYKKKIRYIHQPDKKIHDKGTIYYPALESTKIKTNYPEIPNFNNNIIIPREKLKSNLINTITNLDVLNSLEVNSNLYFELSNNNNNNNNKCCLIEKKYVPNEKNIKCRSYKYDYKLLENNNCNFNNISTNNNQELKIEGINGWSNDNCKNNNILGSCSYNNNKECIDFVDKNFCNNYYGMTWSSKPCNSS